MLRVTLALFLLMMAVAQIAHSMPQGGGGDLYLPPKDKPGYDYSAPPNPSKPSVGTKPKTPAGDEKHEPGMPFDFSYAVNDIPTSNDFQHKANSDGEVTKGEYKVFLPDNRVQVVRYTADWKNGYNAEISYE